MCCVYLHKDKRKNAECLLSFGEVKGLSKNKSFFSKVIIYTLLTLTLIVVFFPILSLVLSSFKTNSEIMTTPEKLFSPAPTFDNYIEAWNSENFRVSSMLFNSIWYSSITVVITLFLSAVCGYVFARGEFRGKKLFFAIFSSLMFISLGSITIYPTFSILSRLRLNNSLWGLIVMQCFGIPVVQMYIVRGFVNALPHELDEAAKIDGCSFTSTFFRIILPNLKPVMITIGMLAFNSSWNSYLMPTLFTMGRPDQQTLIVGIMALKNSGEAASSWNLMFAATTIALIPVLVVYFFGNKYITEGMAAGAVKG